MSAVPLVVDVRGDRVVATLNRPEVRNAIDRETAAALHDLCALLEDHPRTLLLSGAGGHFAAGADIAQLRERGRDDALRGINSSAFDRLRRLPMPSIALMDGFALGGGAELAYACDFRLATPRVRIGNPETGLGILASAGGTWRLRELVPEGLAKEMLLTGRLLDGEAALAAGLVNELVEPDDLVAAGHRWADRIAQQVPLAVRLTKAAFHLPRSAHPYVDDLAQAVLFETDEKEARMTAFLEGRGRR
ncbi:enoyl-CoA hydratase [Nocardioides zeae]|uniref:Enoyl-CoA hydratase n=1 Tax=Nocardioides zeae TaxID=1457234 RepID=A0ACC6IE09_9ACTN|nr:enoyl-CoA hydratase/isomerase family protein [Nocardioides zeae]MDR6174193.1 enoyl-CoA hydratase [Nocardioides zeae]MDR6209000.1 enoyl-CoA hydratase [Nocardioides zeae]